MGDDSSLIYQDMSHAAVTDMMWTSLLLGYSVLLANVEQQKAILVGHAAALFISQVMLAGAQGDKIQRSQAQAGGITTFFSILIALLGAF